MSIRMRCQRCGRTSYSANAAAIVARGDRCPDCGGALELQCPDCGAGLRLPATAAAGGATPDRRAARSRGRRD